MSTIATICARAGSEGVPGKNTRLLRGKPLIAYTIEQALACPEVDDVYFSTDSPEIARIAQSFGAKVLSLRPAHLATSDAPKLPVIQNLIETIESSGVHIDRIVDLDPTSPLRKVQDISDCVSQLGKDTDLVITGYLSDKNPYFNMVERKENGEIALVSSPTSDIAGRQAAPNVYAMNGSVYCWWRSSFTMSLWDRRVKLHEMPRERSVDIDHELDWKLVELLMDQRVGNQVCCTDAPDGPAHPSSIR